MRISNMRRHLAALAIATAGCSVLLTGATSAQAACDGAELVTPGKLTVAYNGDMPGTGTKDGKLIGIDGDIMTKIAEKLGLGVEPALMEWAAEIESVKARRVDIMHGMMGWTKPRTEVIVMTDPIYFAGSLITQRKGDGITTLAQLKEKRIATVQGFAQVTELKTINPDVKLYETTDAAIRDLMAGRIAVVIADPPMMQYLSTKQPELQIESLPVADAFDSKLPILTGKFQVVFGMSKAAPKLEACINKAIAEIWETGENYKAASNYGFADKYWFEAPTENPRLGIDRPQDWKFPMLKN